jgi:CheY-like chemotaxis protein
MRPLLTTQACLRCHSDQGYVLGTGSTFHFTARFGVSAEPVGRRPPPELVQLRGLPVLAVDDNATNRRILQGLLTHWGMKPTVVAGGQQTLAVLRQAQQSGEPFALVLLDNMMPEMDGFTLVEQIHRHPELAGATLMMISSAGRREDAQRCRELGVSAYMTKPIRRAELMEAILRALSLKTPETATARQATHSAESRCARSLRILLAEDNLVNQRLAVRLLEKRGHTVSVAGNGHEALAALEQQSFDAVLMDVQMPEMDGLEATTAIRAQERNTGRHVPIVAMTARAMKGDREDCLAAGMDSYVSKPLQAAELFDTLEQLAGGQGAAVVAETPSPPPGVPSPAELPAASPVWPSPASSPPDFDKAEALQQAAGDEELFRELRAAFLEEYPALLSQIQAAIVQGDARRLERAAHTLKGAAGAVAGAAVAGAAQRLEALGRRGDLAGAATIGTELEAALRRLSAALLAD